jgi:Cu(I)/Ag(I) efflux system membrane fusion protein
LTDAAVAPAQAGAQSSTTYRTTGKVEEVSHGELLISHAPIPELKWPAMTMGFTVPHELPVKVKAGDKVAFEFRQTDGGKFQVTKIEAAR